MPPSSTPLRRAVDRHPPLVYGPVRSRRLGLSLGVNLLPAGLKLCTFDCLYCQCGATESRRRGAADPPFPSLEALEEALDAALAVAPNVEDICLAGDGEPTLHPRFREAVLLSRRLRDRHLPPSATVSVLSNASRAVRLDVRAGLALADRRFLKLDAARQDLFEALDRPPRGLRVESVVEALARLIGIETQTMLVHGPVENATPAALDALGAALLRIRPLGAQLMTVTRAPRSASVTPLSVAELEDVARHLRARAPGVKVDVYP